jgi:hypothetical protein
MGLGIGIGCETCDRQLCYGTDDAAISIHAGVAGDGHEVVRQRPVLCDSCRRIIERWQRLVLAGMEAPT